MALLTSIRAQLFAAAALLPLLSALAGCAVSPAANRAIVYPERTAQIEVVNLDLHERVEIVSGRALYEDEILTGVVQLRSQVEEKQTLEYRWTWYDADDFQQVSEASDHWRTVFVDALEDKQVTGRATQPRAARGVFELRWHSGVTDADR